MVLRNFEQQYNLFKGMEVNPTFIVPEMGLKLTEL